MLDDHLVMATEKWFRLAPAPMMIVDARSLHILAANEAADVMTRSTVFAMSGPGRLYFSDAHIDEDFRSQLQTIHTEPAVVCLRRGDDFLAIQVEHSSLEQHPEALRLTFQGELSGRRVDAGRTLWASLNKAFDLTPAEERVARMMAEGDSVATIAGAMGITVDTIRSHVQRIYLKVGVANREQLTARLAQLRFAARFPGPPAALQCPPRRMAHH